MLNNKAFFGTLVGLMAVFVVPTTVFAQAYGYGGWGYNPYTTQGMYSYYSPLAQYGYSGGGYNPYQTSYSGGGLGSGAYGYGGNSGAYGYGGYNPYGYGGYNPYRGCNPFYQYCPTATTTNTGGPSITNVTGPNTLSVGQSGTWSLTTSAASGTVSVSVNWGDQGAYAPAAAASQMITQNNTFSHAYGQAGTYTITFTVTDAQGRSTSATATVVVSGATQGATLTATPTSGQAPLSVIFTATGGSGTYYIDYGDGSNGTLQPTWCTNSLQGSCGYTGSHVYQSAGTYTASASYAPQCSAIGISCTTSLVPIGTVTITVTSGGTTNQTFSASPTTGTGVPFQTTFTASGLQSTGTYLIDFGDHTPTQWFTGSLTHVYQRIGSYTATLVQVTCNGGPYTQWCGYPTETVVGTAQVQAMGAI
jgi:PKD repeat protein